MFITSFRCSPALYFALKRTGIPIVQTVQNYRLMCINGLFLRDGRICERCRTGKFFQGFASDVTETVTR